MMHMVLPKRHQRYTLAHIVCTVAIVVAVTSFAFSRRGPPVVQDEQVARAAADISTDTPHGSSDMARHREALMRLKRRGFMPETILDCGAYKGRWNRRVAQVVYPDAKVISIEANRDMEHHLKGLEYEIALLGEKNGEERRFYTLDEKKTGVYATGSSMLKERSRHYDGANKAVQERVIPTKTLDSICRERGVADRLGLLKLDVQGAELMALQGAAQVLSKVASVLLEASIVEYNSGAPLMAEVVRYMDGKGFRVCDVVDVMYVDDKLTQADLLFVRSDSEFA